MNAGTAGLIFTGLATLISLVAIGRQIRSDRAKERADQAQESSSAMSSRTTQQLADLQVLRDSNKVLEDRAKDAEKRIRYLEEEVSRLTARLEREGREWAAERATLVNDNRALFSEKQRLERRLQG